MYILELKVMFFGMFANSGILKNIDPEVSSFLAFIAGAGLHRFKIYREFWY